MAVKYSPVQWTRNKFAYDAVLLIAIAAYIMLYLNVAPRFFHHGAAIDDAIVRARAFGTCAFVMVTCVLCIGPLARLDQRFLPLLYNRRHFGVLTLFVAMTHAGHVLDWYFNFSPTPRLTALLSANTSYAQVLGFPFETLGILALLCLALLAATSHDFWLSFLGPRTWKGLHYLLYAAYTLMIAHVSLGALQSELNSTFAVVVGCSVALVCGLHVAAALNERRNTIVARNTDGWLEVGDTSQFQDGRARVVMTPGGERIAVFRHGAKLSAISNACAHQNGPLGEGLVIDGCVTCPWHGFQYRLTDGCSPDPFTERVPTYGVRVDGTTVWVDPKANPPGTHIDAVTVAEFAK